MSNTVEQLDLASLQPYLQREVEDFGEIRQCEKFSGGQSNPTFLITADGGRYVLRRKPPGELLKSAHAVDREYRVMHALRDTPVPVPRMFVLCEDESVIGSVFYLMEFVEGRIHWNGALPDATPEERGVMYRNMAGVLAAIHQVDVEQVGLSDFGKPGNYFARQLSRWSKQYHASETEKNPAMDRLIAWLEQNLPEDDGRVALIHGDYRIDNLIFHPKRPDILAVLDWELSTLGHPWGDIAYQCMQLRLPQDAAIPGLGGLDRRQLGIPTEEEYLAEYCRLAGISDIPNWNFYIVFNYFRLAAILQGIQKRALDGNASSSKAFEYGRMARPLSETGASLID
ncbi:MAG: phosphotransferase [Ectothiorhodospiraceae bacterium]|nr:phosphotransferase [Ectothiorhodospiraceae bacterium]MCH8505525.1 phosphotransferase [Ectothiorhodospiraceae bacterium]